MWQRRISASVASRASRPLREGLVEHRHSRRGLRMVARRVETGEVGVAYELDRRTASATVSRLAPPCRCPSDEVAEQRRVRPLAAVVGGDPREVEDRRLVRGREIERRGVDSRGIRDRVARGWSASRPRGRSYVARSARRSESAFMPHSLARRTPPPTLPLGERLHAPLAGKRGRLRPGWGLVAQGGERGGGVKRRYSPVEAQVLRLCRESGPAASAASSVPYSWRTVAAVFGPTPFAPGILSEGSPRSAMKSGTCSGSTP